LLVYDAIVVELKALKELNSDHEAQLFNYMRIAQQPVGYLIDFGRRKELEWKRLILSDLHRRE
jgi:GxxExxY protein